MSLETSHLNAIQLQSTREQHNRCSGYKFTSMTHLFYLHPLYCYTSTKPQMMSYPTHHSAYLFKEDVKEP